MTMTIYSQISLRVQRCEDGISRLVHECIAHGELTAGETRQLRLIISELIALNRDIAEQKAELGRLTAAIQRLAPSGILH
jgi:hypothetical protein